MADKVKHPMVPLPPHLLPTMQRTLAGLRELQSTHDAVELFICAAIGVSEPDKTLMREARSFVHEALGGYWSLGFWLREFDRDFTGSRGYINKSRIAWLKWLTEEKS